ncbi:MAG: hypothetical protein BAJATHORv1_10205 [Candidatus Thorarchaeota archaeon]|nr:MAG: hypothetical protein BAJATHORv1_10205 [Candidatus Thorarchaeota archaeon]
MSGGNIRDDLTESMILKDVRILLSEYIPCDRNILEDIGNKLMSTRHVHGEFVTMLVDKFPESTTFTSESEINFVRVIDAANSEYIASEIKIQDPDDDSSIEQEETVGMYISHDGHVVYGAEIFETCGEETNINGVSLDKISRVVVDLIYDSSLMMETLLTHHQRRLMDCIYKGESRSRYKFVGMLASSMAPNFDDITQYMDGEEYQNELEQLLDNLIITHRLNDGSLLLVGDAGLILVSENWSKYESLVSFYALVRSAEMFVDGLYHRMSLLWDELAQVRILIEKTASGDHSVITRAQNILTEASANFTIIQSIGSYLKRGFALLKEKWLSEREGVDEEAVSVLNFQNTFDRLMNRISDTDIDLQSLSSEVEGLQTLLSTQIEQQMRRVYSALRDNTQSTSEVIRASERTGNVLNVIELILSGTIAFDIVLAITGEYSTDFHLFPESNPILFFTLAVTLWTAIVIVLKKGMDWLESKVEKSHLVRVTLNQKCDVAAIEEYLANKEIISIDEEFQDDSEDVRVHYILPSKGEDDTKVTLHYDRRNGIINDLTIEANSEYIGIAKEKIIKDLQSCFSES